MRTVEPIRDPEKVRELEQVLERAHNQRGQRMYLMLMVGIYLGLRISDMLKLRVDDLRGKNVLMLKEQKTSKNAQLSIPDKLKRVCRDRLAGLPGDSFIFESRQRDRFGISKAISRMTAYNDMQAMADIAKLDYPMGCHSLRKTFGYHYYKQTGDIAFLMIWFNHSSMEVTKRYIGIDLDERVKKISKFLNIDPKGLTKQEIY